MRHRPLERDHLGNNFQNSTDKPIGRLRMKIRTAPAPQYLQSCPTRQGIKVVGFELLTQPKKTRRRIAACCPGGR
jgi:hypothetical protein